MAENNLFLFNQLFYSATRRIVAVSPYFVPDESMLTALITAARAGRGELFVSEIGDQFLVFHAQRSTTHAAGGRGAICSTGRRRSCTPSTSRSTTRSA